MQAKCKACGTVIGLSYIASVDTGELGNRWLALQLHPEACPTCGGVKFEVAMDFTLLV